MNSLMVPLGLSGHSVQYSVYAKNKIFFLLTVTWWIWSRLILGHHFSLISGSLGLETLLIGVHCRSAK